MWENLDARARLVQESAPSKTNGKLWKYSADLFRIPHKESPSAQLQRLRIILAEHAPTRNGVIGAELAEERLSFPYERQCDFIPFLETGDCVQKAPAWRLRINMRESFEAQ